MTIRTGLSWYKSSFSGNNEGECVEVATLPEGGQLVRDTKDHGSGPVLSFSSTEWAAFTAAVRNGEFH